MLESEKGTDKLRAFRFWRGLSLRFRDRLDHNELAHRTFVDELYSAADLREQGVVFTATDVQSCFVAGPALTNDDGASGDGLPAEDFHSEPLRVRVAPIS